MKLIYFLICLCLIFIVFGIWDANGKLFTNNYEKVMQLFPKLQGNSEILRSVTTDNQHPCNRICIENQFMTCYYYFVVHYDSTMGESCKKYLRAKYRFKVNGREYIDNLKLEDIELFNNDCKYGVGSETELMLVNNQLPGPSIEVCYGDTIVADVINSMHEKTTVHWHGIHQRKTPHMDGVPHVTQYPIEPGQAFRYRFEVDHTGTNWWHSHTVHQRAFGLAGPLIVRQPDKVNPHVHLYDFDEIDHVIMIQDWVHNFEESVAENILINGRGRDIRKNSKVMPILYSTFTVVRGGRYRFRVILNGVSNCPISLSIDKHDLVVISSDGNDIQPVKVQKIMIHSAERYDFVLHANQENSNYWIRIKGHSFCATNKIHQEAVLHYKDADYRSFDTRTLSYFYDAPGVILNDIDESNTKNNQNVPLTNLNAVQRNPTLTPVVTYYTSMVVEEARGEGFRFQMDDITFDMPNTSLLQTRNLGIGQFFCNSSQLRNLGFNCKRRHCKCSNVIQVPSNIYVEFVISSKSSTAHPIHLHGYTFRVVGMSILGDEHIEHIEEYDRQTPLQRRKEGSPLKDTVQVPPYGYTIIQFYSDSPGYWIFHCHISPHSENGMAAVMRIGEDNEMLLCPVSNCGLCHSLT